MLISIYYYLKKSAIKLLSRFILVTGIGLLCSFSAFTQNVTQVEYFIDTDPGQGLATNVPITPGANLSNLVFPIDVASIAPGFHNLYVRAKDDSLKWSLTAVRPFYKEVPNVATLPDVTKVEYFIDTDPGYGMAINVPITSGANLSNLVFPFDIVSITPGFHNLYVRAKDDSLKWSLTAVRPFYKEISTVATLPNVTQVEYFIDTDPGHGMAINVPITPGTNLSNLVIPIDMAGITPGFHNLCIRAKDDSLKWSLTAVRPFYKESANITIPDVTKVEYYIDNDPGFGLGIDVPVTPSANINDLSFLIDLNSMTFGPHIVAVRSKDSNGKWSLTGHLEVEKFQLTAFLEGLYAGGGIMNQAYDDLGPHFGSDTADLVSIELHNSTNYSTIEQTINNVNISTSGKMAIPIIPYVYNGSCYITIKHRNSIETTTSSPVLFTSSNISYDFSTAATQAYGDNMKSMDGVYVIYGADPNQDGTVDGTDMLLLDNASQPPVLKGYFPEDLNGDGTVDGTDMVMIDNSSQPPVVMVKKP